MEIAQHPSVQNCEECSGAPDDLEHLCMTHFIATSYEKLEELKRSTQVWSVGGPAWEAARRFTRDCNQIATNFSKQKPELSNLERARLTDIAIWAAELGRSLRRGLRRTLAISIRLISETPGRSWEEDTQTLDVTRYGVRTRCRNPVKNGDVLNVLRLDSGERIESRVVWHRRTTPDLQEIGLEVIGDKTFKIL